MALGSLWSHFATILGLLWGHLGVTLGSLWGHFGVTLGSLWGHFGVTLGSLWNHFGVTLGHFGITLGSLWGLEGPQSAPKGSRRTILSDFGSILEWFLIGFWSKLYSKCMCFSLLQNLWFWSQKNMDFRPSEPLIWRDLTVNLKVFRFFRKLHRRLNSDWFLSQN